MSGWRLRTASCMFGIGLDKWEGLPLPAPPPSGTQGTGTWEGHPHLWAGWREVNIGRTAHMGGRTHPPVGPVDPPTSRACSVQHAQHFTLFLHQDEQEVAEVWWEVAADHPAGVGVG